MENRGWGLMGTGRGEFRYRDDNGTTIVGDVPSHLASHLQGDLSRGRLTLPQALAAQRNLDRARQPQQQTAAPQGRGLGGADQASRDIYGATYGQAEETMQDPVLNQLTQRLEGVMSGENTPWNDDRISRELTDRADMSAAGATNQANQLRDWAARMNISPNDPAFQARLQEINANRMQANQQSRGDIGRVSVAQNFDAQQSALNRAMQERFNRLGLANQQRLTGAGYSAQVQEPVSYQNPNAEIYDLIAQMAMQPQQTVAPYQPQQQVQQQQTQQQTQGPQQTQQQNPQQPAQQPTWSGSVSVDRPGLPQLPDALPLQPQQHQAPLQYPQPQHQAPLLYPQQPQRPPQQPPDPLFQYRSTYQP